MDPHHSTKKKPRGSPAGPSHSHCEPHTEAISRVSANFSIGVSVLGEPAVFPCLFGGITTNGSHSASSVTCFSRDLSITLHVVLARFTATECDANKQLTTMPVLCVGVGGGYSLRH